MAVCIAEILRCNDALSKAAVPPDAAAPAFARSSSCAMFSAAITAMRSVPAILPESRISRMRLSRNCTACCSSSRSLSLQATRYSRPRITTSSMIERSSMGISISVGRLWQLLHERIQAGAGRRHARGERALLIEGATELALERFVLGAQPVIIGEQRREFLFQSAEHRIHAPTIGGSFARRQPVWKKMRLPCTARDDGPDYVASGS